MQQINFIVEQTAMVFACTVDDILARLRKPTFVYARQAAMWVVRERYPSIPLETIGASIGGRHYTTVMHALHMVKQRKELNPLYQAQIEQVLQHIPAKPSRFATKHTAPSIHIDAVNTKNMYK